MMKSLDANTSVGLPAGTSRLGRVWWLNLSYDEDKDEYFAYVDDGTLKGIVVYQIDDTNELIEYIKTGRMKHLDDVEGLTKFLIEQNFIDREDVIKLNKVQTW